MSLSFRTLMERAAVATANSMKEVESLLAQREADQRQARLEQEQREAKEREVRKATFLREMELKKKREEQEAANLATQAAREAEQVRQGWRERDRILRLSSSKIPSGSSLSRKRSQATEHKRDKSRSSSPRNHGFDHSVLSREEKRALADPLLREAVLGIKPKPSSSVAKIRPKKGGASFISPAHKSGRSVSTRDRIIAERNNAGLIRLNTVKKDLRTIDEIQRDLERGRHGGSAQRTELVGPEAATFTDWFGKSKKEREKEAAEKAKKEKEEAERKAMTAVIASSASSTAASASSRAISDFSPGSKAFNTRPTATLSSSRSAPSSPRPSMSSTKSTLIPSSSKTSASTSSHPPSLARPSTKLQSSSSSLVPKKRSVADDTQSVSDDVASKRRKQNVAPFSRRRDEEDADNYDSAVESDSEDDGFNYRPGLIASLMGRNIERDAQRELAMSESEISDNEPSARRKKSKKDFGYEALMREEARSARIARKEDEEEEKKLKLNEEMKRKKKEERRREMESRRAAGVR